MSGGWSTGDVVVTAEGKGTGTAKLPVPPKKYAIPIWNIVSMRNKKMVKIIRNFNRKDCVHYEVVESDGCCGRPERHGVCAIPEGECGVITYKTCSMKQPYCRYQKKEEAHVHSTKL